MTIVSYVTFVGASVLLVLVPGPDMLYLLSRCTAQAAALGRWRRSVSTWAAMFIFLRP